MSKQEQNKERVRISKEKFIYEFCKQRGWNPRELTTGQMLFIITQSDFKNIK
jgi:predicted HicB family RNase H-like nuclease